MPAGVAVPFRRATRPLRLPALAAVVALAPGLSPAPAAELPWADRVAPVRAEAAALTPAMAKALDAPASAPLDAIVHFRGGTSASWTSVLADHGLSAAHVFQQVPVVYATGTVAEFRALSHSPAVTLLEANERLRVSDDTSRYAGRVREIQDVVGSGPYRDAAGHVVDGRGIGIAVIDTGVFTAHPDLRGRVRRNFKALPCAAGCRSMLQERPPESASNVTDGHGTHMAGITSDATSGHGTHVAGITVGDGTASEGLFRGVAPGAGLFAFGAGQGLEIELVHAAAAYDWIVTHRNADPEFPIRVINNSWGTDGSRLDLVRPGVVERLAIRGTELGIVSVFAAGNNGGNGSLKTTSKYCDFPTRGIVCAANYDDLQTGTRQGRLYPSSARAQRNDQDPAAVSLYPDISAPGTGITSTCTPTLPLCNVVLDTRWAPHYTSSTGTSMAAPHVAGVAALLFQARPDLTPAQVEDVLVDTAHPYGDAATYVTDPRNPDGRTSFDKGAGLIDALAALQALGVAGDGAPAAAPPAVHIDSPAPGRALDGRVEVRGTANDGRPGLRPPVAVTVATDAVDLAFPGPADLATASVRELPEGLRWTLAARDLAAVSPQGVRLEVAAHVGGTLYRSGVAVGPTGASAFAGPGYTAVTDVAADSTAGTVSFTVPFTAIGDPAPGTTLFKVYARSVVAGVGLDYAPGTAVAVEEDATLSLTTNARGWPVRPHYGTAFSVARPDRLPARAVPEVWLRVDGGAPQPAVLTGTSPRYSFSGTVDLSALPPGPRAVSATLSLDGVTAADQTVTVAVAPTYDVEIAVPPDLLTVERSPTPVRGTVASSRPPGPADRVTVAVAGGPEQEADGVADWSAVVDFSTLPSGTYPLTARYHVDGAVVDRDTVSVVVPVERTSYSPRPLSFWGAQFDDNAKEGEFTAVEAVALAQRAAERSSGWFADAGAVRTAVALAPLDHRARAERQYAALLLNLAAGELSAEMSVRCGLSGRERLDPSVYDTAVVGHTVADATAWIRAQLRGGALTAAASVGSTVNGGEGLR